MSKVKSRPLAVSEDAEAFFDFVLKMGWSDGLPMIPPTAERVAAMLSTTKKRPDEELGVLGPRWGVVSIEKVAINAVLAGCLPDYFPVVVSAVDAIMDDAFNVDAIQTTTNPASLMLIINGPVIGRIGLNAGAGVFGPGFRANATIGRAVRLVMRNVGGGIPGNGDQSTHGSPAKYSFCIAENESESPWPPLHVDQGFSVGSSAVTVCPVAGPDNVVCLGAAGDPRAYLQNMGRAVASPGNNAVFMQDPEVIVVLGPDAAKTIAGAGISKEAARHLIFDSVRLPLEQFAPANLEHFRRTKEYALQGSELRPLSGPERIKIVVAGGPGEHSAYCASFNLAHSVTREIAD